MRLRPLIAACLGVAGLAAAGAAPAAPPSTGPSGIGWEDCGEGHEELAAAGAQCALITVPLDYTNPAGDTVGIAISRIPAADQENRRGILLANPGGPGGPGLDYPLALRPALGDVADRYDLIGFDPRFIGESSPVTCAPAGPRAPMTGSPREIFDATVRGAADLAERCTTPEGNAELLAHASTRNVARDMDSIRAALGEPALSYYGVSYGADLGAVYTQMFPERADRIVLDSSTDPSRTQYQLFQDAGPAAEAGLDEWARWTAARHAEYRLGRRAHEVRATVERLVARAERRPVAIGGYQVDATQLRLVLRQLVQHQEDNAALARAVRNLVDAAAGHQVEPDPLLDMWLRVLNSPDLDPVFAAPAYTFCADGGWPAGGWPDAPEDYWHAIRESRAEQPVFGPLANAIGPCPFWPGEPREPGTVIANDTPVLMLHALRDINTPYPGGVALHEALTGSRLVTADIRSHGVYGRGAEGKTPIPCVDEAVNDYLAGGRLPAEDTSCP
ncbi:alpha/beta hydrolase [Streptomyces litchfieldiae]|uniref:Alpha/beta hydrolase n=1 Tax=Streptomyces litchfieldiae TaxID=3075543 RepID=A0ABU2MWI7_9ACTN|nr:alpha/beta hydrolase [Streptomyces sp. DSM 44938]MDT0345203.1 alpha/beta hydrolase [Streptomyces sp. DSM 44938]